VAIVVNENDLGADVRWNLGDLFSGMDDPRIEASLVSSQARAEKMQVDYKGKINVPDLTAETLSKALREYEDIQQEAAKPGTYGPIER